MGKRQRQRKREKQVTRTYRLIKPQVTEAEWRGRLFETMPLLQKLDVAGGLHEDRRHYIVTRKSPAKRQD